MKYQMQIQVENNKGEKIWRSVHPTGGAPYEYDTRAEAWRMLEMCYPDSLKNDVRVIEVANA